MNTMKKFCSVITFLLAIAIALNAQVITADPTFPTDADAVTITFDATQGSGGLSGYTGDVYAHTGVITNTSTSNSDWKYAPTWGDNSEKYKLTRIGDNLYQLAITPSIRDYYGVASGEIIERLAFVFRSSDNTREGKDIGNTDIFYTVYTEGLSVAFSAPISNDIFMLNDSVEWSVIVTDTSDILVTVNDVEIYSANTSTANGKYKVITTNDQWFKVTANNGIEEVADSVKNIYQK